MKRFSTTNEFINNHVRSGGFPAGEVVEMLGYSSKGDQGAALWKATGSTIASSQTVIDTNDIKISDASGNEFELVHIGIIDLNALGGTGGAYVTIATNAGLTWSQSFTSIPSNATLNYDTTSDMVNAAGLAVGDVVETAEFSTGNGGGGVYDVVLTSSVTPNGYNIIQGVADTTISFVLRIDGVIFSKQWGMTGDGATDDTAAYQSFRDYIASNPEIKAVFQEGVYLYSTSPNWAIEKANVVFEGDVTLKCTGTGNALIFDAGSGTELVFDFNFGWGNKPFVEGNSNTPIGVYIRSCHHCKIGAKVTGCATTGDAFKIDFSVLGEYDFVSSVNQQSFVSKPLRGIVLDRRNAGEDTSACIFYNIIIEGMGGTGVYVDHALMNNFIGGTSEGNTGTNIECSTNSRNNTFDGVDLEVPGNGIGVIDAGDRNHWENLLNDSDLQITSAATRCYVVGGVLDSIDNQGTATTLDSVNYGSATGELTDTGTLTTIINAYDLESATFKESNKLQGKLQISQTTTTGAWAAPGAVPGTVTKNITVTGAVLGDTVVAAEAVDAGTNYILHARVTAADTVRVAYTQITGTATSPHPAGVDITLRLNGK